jgi:hypothetical protein
MMTKLPKYLKQQLDGMKWPTVLVFKDKHSNDYYLLKDVEALGRACLDVLKARLDPEYGYIRNPGPEKDIYGLQEELPKDAAEALPEPYRTQALKAIKYNAKKRAEWAEDLERYCMAKKALKEKDGMTAFMILHERRNYEYEGYEFVGLTVP